MEQKTNYYRVQTETISGRFEASKYGYYSKPDHWFETSEKATADFLRVRAIAKTRAENILKEFNDLQSRLGFHVGFTYEGDTHGIYDAYQYIRFTEEKYDFTLKIEND
jgi:hypothetical protein